MAGRLRLGLALVVLSTTGMVSGCAERTERPARVDPPAEEALRRMSAALSAAESFSFSGAMTMDELLDSGRLAEFSRETRIVVRRPDRLFAEVRRGENTWYVWHAGRDLTILDEKANTYASVQVPAVNDDMLDHLAREYDLTMPLADLLFADPYKVLAADVLTGHFVGIHEANGVKCTHLLFTQENVDWQVWIATDEPPLPKKVLIDYKNLPGRPQFSALLSDWNLNAAAGYELFKPTLPADVSRVEMAQLLKTEQGKQ